MLGRELSRGACLVSLKCPSLLDPRDGTAERERDSLMLSWLQDPNRRYKGLIALSSWLSLEQSQTQEVVSQNSGPNYIDPNLVIVPLMGK